jgi:hypothetical protein
MLYLPRVTSCEVNILLYQRTLLGKVIESERHYLKSYNNIQLLDKISQQPENCENRNDPDLVQAFLKKWWVESDFK